MIEDDGIGNKTKWAVHGALPSQSAGVNGDVQHIAEAVSGVGEEIGEFVAVAVAEPSRVQAQQPAGHASFTAAVRARMRSSMSSCWRR